MRSYARLQDDRVMETLHTEAPIETLFHPDLRWVETTGQEAVAAGWRMVEGRLLPPLPAPPPAPPPAPSLETLRVQLAEIERQLRALSG